MLLEVNAYGLPLQVELSPCQAPDAPLTELLLQQLPAGTNLLVDSGYDADWIREVIEDQHCIPVIPPKSNKIDEIAFARHKYQKRNLVEHCIKKLKQFRHFATAMTAILHPHHGLDGTTCVHRLLYGLFHTDCPDHLFCADTIGQIHDPADAVLSALRDNVGCAEFLREL